jgi:hypothetical protein
LISTLRIVGAAILTACPAIAATCESLTSLSVPGVTVTSAAVAATPVEFCRVQAVAKPVADSEILVELWLPPARTKAEREATGDPRPSIEERYGTHDRYVAKVKAAARQLVKERFLVQEDAGRLVSQAEASNVLK